MEWMKDDELFADVDRTGRLTEDEMTKYLTGSAEESIRAKMLFYADCREAAAKSCIKSRRRKINCRIRFSVII